MATPANNAAVLTNSLFLMECFLFFSLRLPRAGPIALRLPRAGPIAYRLRGKRICLPCSSDRPQEMLRCRAARFPVIRGEPNMQDDLGNWSLAAERTAHRSRRYCSALSSAIPRIKELSVVPNGLSRLYRTLGPLFGPLRKAFVVVSDP